MKFKLGILALLIFLSSCASHSRKDSYPVFPLAKNSDKSYGLEEMTGQALEYKMKGDYKKSYMLFKSILSRLEEKYEFLSQIYLHFMNYLAIDTSLEEEYLDFLQQYIKGNTSSGRDLAMYFLMGAWEKRALREKALKISDELGFITQWYLLGPFKNEGRNGLDYTLPPEFEIDLGKTYTESAYHPLRWRKINSSLGGPIDLNNYLTPEKNSLAFLLTYIQVPESGYYTVALGTDDGYMLWINDRLINKNDIYRKGYFDQEKFRVFLNKGLNRILLKLSQEYQNFELYFRIFPVDFQVVLTGSETFTPQDNSKQPAYPVAIKEKSFPDLEEKIPFLKEFFLGYYYFITGNFPDNKKMDAFWFQKALEKEKASLFYYYAALASSEN
ncbi:MAG: hypothetical protein JW827_03750, partial [Spirochaetes bacterium]|nr:hypothetical protein [Spirochaetota bacterium]